VKAPAVKAPRFPDEPLRVRALDVLGPVGEPVARAVLEHGAVEVEPTSVEWDGSTGHVRGHRVVIVVHASVASRFEASYAARDALVAALAAAMAERKGEAVTDVRVEAGEPARVPGGGPYRGGR
jgi:hypothetical protein